MEKQPLNGISMKKISTIWELIQQIDQMNIRETFSSTNLLGCLDNREVLAYNLFIASGFNDLSWQAELCNKLERSQDRRTSAWTPALIMGEDECLCTMLEKAKNFQNWEENNILVCHVS